MVKETILTNKFFQHLLDLLFQSPLGEVVKETIDWQDMPAEIRMFQSPLGEVVKETKRAMQRRESANNCFNPLSGKW